MGLETAKRLSNLEPVKTWDRHTNNRIEFLHPIIRNVVATAINECEQLGFKVRITADGHLRLFDVQDMLYGHGRTKEELKLKGINPDYAKPNESWKTNAIGAESYHNYGLAIDILTIDGKTLIWEPNSLIVDVFKRYGFEWGGDWKKRDAPHFQITFGYKCQELYKLYSAHKVDEKGYIKFAD